MAGDVILFEPPAHLQKYKTEVDNSDLTSGVQASFAVLSFKGKVWRVKYQGEEKIIKNRDGDPASSLIAVIVKASPQVSKIYYPGAYTEGDQDAPSCFSIDGVRPDPGAAEPQSNTCAGCPKNIWGSKITEQGNKTKACSDSRRIAVVPYPDLRNEAFGGPLLLRIPPASLQEIYRYGKYLQDMGVNYNMLVTKITFDAEAAYPRLMFSVMEHPESGQPIWMDEAQMETIKELRDGDVIDRMLAEAPITDDAMTVAQAAQQPAEAGPGSAEASPAPVEEKAPPAPAEEAAADPVVEVPPETKKETKPKPSPKEANAEEGAPTTEALDSLIGNLL